jgi:hypothetical protein
LPGDAHLWDDVPSTEFLRQGSERAAFEIEPEHRADRPLACQRWLKLKGWSRDDVFIDLHDMRAGEKWRETLASRVGAIGWAPLARPRSPLNSSFVYDRIAGQVPW